MLSSSSLAESHAPKTSILRGLLYLFRLVVTSPTSFLGADICLVDDENTIPLKSGDWSTMKWKYPGRAFHPESGRVVHDVCCHELLREIKSESIIDDMSQQSSLITFLRTGKLHRVVDMSSPEALFIESSLPTSKVISFPNLESTNNALGEHLEVL